jgi:DNA-binding transcriptional LysR family regulator
MRREQMADLTALVVVAEERNFTRAATKLGLSQSALSQIVSRLEERLGVRLLVRTTRSVAPTEAGERLVRTLAPMLHDLDQSIADLSAFRDKPAGSIRITTVEHAAKTVLLPRLSGLLRDHPDISLEIIVDYGLADIVADRFDAGVRLGEHVAKDMIAVRISPDIPMAIVGSPSYFACRSAPREPRDLVEHRCVNLRLPTSGALNAWRLVKDGRETRVRVEGPLTFNAIDLILDAALVGMGLAYLPLDQVKAHVDDGRLAIVLAKWTPALPAYHLYYPHRRHASLAFRLVVDALRCASPAR